MFKVKREEETSGKGDGGKKGGQIPIFRIDK